MFHQGQERIVCFITDITADQTNLYAAQFVGSHQEMHPTINNEMRQFIALLILQSINKNPRLEMYFSQRQSTRSPFF